MPSKRSTGSDLPTNSLKQGGSWFSVQDTLEQNIPFLNVGDSPDVQPDRRRELQGLAARGGLGITEHDANPVADLVDEDGAGPGTTDRCGQLVEGLRHEAGLEPHDGARAVHLLNMGDREVHLVLAPGAIRLRQLPVW